MLQVRDLIADYDAVMSSENDLVGLLDPDSDWPHGLTIEEDLVALAGTSVNSLPIRCPGKAEIGKPSMTHGKATKAPARA